MNPRDLTAEFSLVNSLAPATRTTTVDGAAADLAGYDVAAVLVIAGTVTDGTHAITIQDSDNNSDWSNVDSALLSVAPANVASNVNQEISYLGNKRYLRAVTTIGGAPSTGGAYAVVIVRSGAITRPV